jgi:hypothetical protein
VADVNDLNLRTSKLEKLLVALTTKIASIQTRPSLFSVKAGRKVMVNGDYLEVLPVGMIVLTEANDNPSTLGIPGTWEAY